MDFIYTTLKSFLDSLIPSSMESTWGNINEILAYVLTLCLIWFVFVKPIALLFFGRNRR